MIERRKHETDSDLVQTLLGHFRGSRNIHAQRGKDIGTATAAAGGAIAVFRYRQSGSSNDESRSRGNIKSLGATRSGPGSVDEATVARVEAHGPFAHTLSESGQLFDGF